MKINARGFFLNKQVLHRVKDESLECTPTSSVLVLPEKLVSDSLGEFHFSYGHLGRDKLLSILTSMYYSPSLYRVCLSIVQGCHLCQIIKPGNARLPPVVPSKTAEFPMNIFAIDFFTVPSYRNYKTVLIGADHFSGFIITKACKS